MSRLVKYGNVEVDSNCYRYSNVADPYPLDGGETPGAAASAAQKTCRRSEAEKTIEQAREESKRIIESAQNMAKRIESYTASKALEEMEEAKKKGYEAGYFDGKKKGEEHCTRELGELEELLRNIDEKKEEILKNYEDQLGNLAMDIARKVIGSKMKVDEETFLSIYRKAVDKFNGQKWVKVTVSEHDAEFATTNSELLLSMVKGAQHIDIVALEGAPEGTCIVETPQGIADASIGTQFKKLELAFANQR